MSRLSSLVDSDIELLFPGLQGLGLSHNVSFDETGGINRALLRLRVSFYFLTGLIWNQFWKRHGEILRK